MKSCEHCMSAATTYCESDRACLCWHCDAKVHGANFLVARHVRYLLCHVCQSRTTWRAAGFKLGRAVSECETCVKGGDQEESQAENDDEDEEDNHVLRRCTISNTPPSAARSSSSVDSSRTEAEVDLCYLSAKQTHGHSRHSAIRCRLEEEADSFDSVPV
ncbi:B-box domain protein 31-like [Hibiscus syriacus]|uniref:B-box domain protein 31-like n=1 Tax=Hibiscus syriacus TaxID=106335 RepID=UPI0019227385|nr:B-box domain protein 31-like [Hibiscus syriacus]